ncbi:MAG: hypothetical protein F6I01_002110 [Aerococcus sanguinicola]
MMITWLACMVITGRTTFEDLPKVLKPKVYAELASQGVEFLAGDYKPEDK